MDVETLNKFLKMICMMCDINVNMTAMTTGDDPL